MPAPAANTAPLQETAAQTPTTHAANDRNGPQSRGVRAQLAQPGQSVQPGPGVGVAARVTQTLRGGKPAVAGAGVAGVGATQTATEAEAQRMPGRADTETVAQTETYTDTGYEEELDREETLNGDGALSEAARTRAKLARGESKNIVRREETPKSKQLTGKAQAEQGNDGAAESQPQPQDQGQGQGQGRGQHPGKKPGQTPTAQTGHRTERPCTIPELSRICDDTPGCTGFNSNGWLKSCPSFREYALVAFGLLVAFLSLAVVWCVLVRSVLCALSVSVLGGARRVFSRSRSSYASLKPQKPQQPQKPSRLHCFFFPFSCRTRVFVEEGVDLYLRRGTLLSTLFFFFCCSLYSSLGVCLSAWCLSVYAIGSWSWSVSKYAAQHAVFALFLIL